jgi:3-hydroxyisobutyrate dehydrogenase-like beta-hydroxyacid dehydrogenase
MILTFLGFGELSGAWAGALRPREDLEVRVYARPPRDPAAAQEQARRAGAAGVELDESLVRAVSGADVVLACVPSHAALEVGSACLEILRPGTVYVDPTPADPETKRALAERMLAHGVAYADVALLGTVVVSGLDLPMIAAGPGAARWAEIGAGLGMRITPIEGDAGRAAAIKLIRSVYMKGRDALVLEMLVAARRHGVEHDVIRSIGGAGERVPFDALADRVMGALSVHAARRADELRASAGQLRTVGVDPLVTEAAERRLRWLADLGVHERLPRRSDVASDVLDAIDELVGPPT